MGLGVMIIVLSCMVFYLLVIYIIFSSVHERYDPSDPEKRKFGHKPRMKYITKLTCGQVIARLWMDSYSPFDYQFGTGEGDNYIFAIKKPISCRCPPGRAEYKVVIVPEQEWSAVYFLIIDYRASQYALDTFAWELKKLLEKKLEAVRVE